MKIVNNLKNKTIINFKLTGKTLTLYLENDEVYIVSAWSHGPGSYTIKEIQKEDVEDDYDKLKYGLITQNEFDEREKKKQLEELKKKKEKLEKKIYELETK